MKNLQILQSPKEPAPKTPKPPKEGAIDINTADASALKKFNGVGPATAKKIVDYREANGPFASCDDLTKVKGIGAKTLEKIKPMCTASTSANNHITLFRFVLDGMKLS